jgi:hypothetical protein
MMTRDILFTNFLVNASTKYGFSAGLPSGRISAIGRWMAKSLLPLRYSSVVLRALRQTQSAAHESSRSPQLQHRPHRMSRNA